MMEDLPSQAPVLTAIPETFVDAHICSLEHILRFDRQVAYSQSEPYDLGWCVEDQSLVW